MYNFKDLKTSKTYIYVLNRNGQIEAYDLNKDPNSLFDISNYRFSDGWGGSWDYKDYGITWSFDKTALMESRYNKYASSNKLLEEIKNAESAIQDDNLLAKIIRARFRGFYGAMYGDPKDKKIYIKGSTIGGDGNLYYIWGMPGPDHNVYKHKDYGITWALTEEEFEDRGGKV